MCGMFSIDDQDHGDRVGSFRTLDAALGELNRLARIPWDEKPNHAPCTSWETCGRSWALRAQTSTEPDAPSRVVATLEVSRRGPQWSIGPDAVPAEVDAIGPRVRRGRARRIRLRIEHGHHRERGT